MKPGMNEIDEALYLSVFCNVLIPFCDVLRFCLWENLILSAYGVNRRYTRDLNLNFPFMTLAGGLTSTSSCFIWKFTNPRLTSPSGPIRYSILIPL